MKIEYGKSYSNGQHLTLTITDADDVNESLAKFAQVDAVAKNEVRADLGFEPKLKGASAIDAITQINDAAKTLLDVPPVTIAQAIEEAKLETTPAASEEDSITALRAYVKSKGAPAAIELLASFGVARVTELQPEQRASFIERAA